MVDDPIGVKRSLVVHREGVADLSDRAECNEQAELLFEAWDFSGQGVVHLGRTLAMADEGDLSLFLLLI